jgi:hypothetical protein
MKAKGLPVILMVFGLATGAGFCFRWPIHRNRGESKHLVLEVMNSLDWGIES